LLLMRHPAGDPSFADIMQIKQNANRAANLVRQLLAFSRRQTLQPKTVDLTEVLAELSNLIRRLIGENIQMKMLHGRDLGMVKADQGQLEQVIINLAVNARDAMKDGGTLTIASRNVRVDGPDSLDRGLIAPTDDDIITADDYVLVEVSDTGSGIPPEIIRNIFEPFFSTKEIGSGTGLGLSTCYGIIKQTGGYIFVKTEKNVGTSFHLYFKRFEADAKHAPTHESHEEKPGADLTGRATVLLVEDETPVRIFAARALRNKGYEVLEADSGENAIEVFSDYSGVIDIIISDVMMPGINGPKMITSLYADHAERMKDIKVVFISGYAEDAFVDSFGTERQFNFLPKPFTLKQLASKVKEVLDGSAE
jgi:two-component system cell cycle sensor histidine kinase/response regulator CckA